MKLNDTEIRGDSDTVYEMIKIAVRYEYCSAKGETINTQLLETKESTAELTSVISIIN